MRHDRHEVSAKAALYSEDGQSVLVMRYPRRGRTGLPGGHVDKGESPEVALRREMIEELNLTAGHLERKDFFLSGEFEPRIILAFIGTIPGDSLMTPTDPTFEYGEWVSMDTFKTIDIISPHYRQFVLENWPVLKP